MKVKELIDLLLKEDQEAEVMTDGYETGLNDIRKVAAVTVYKNFNRPYYIGRYDTVKNEYTDPDAQPISAVFLPRLDHHDSLNE